jgi:hypothetical protein
VYHGFETAVIWPKTKVSLDDAPVGLQSQPQAGGVGLSANKTGMGMRQFSHRLQYATSRAWQASEFQRDTVPDSRGQNFVQNSLMAMIKTI